MTVSPVRTGLRAAIPTADGWRTVELNTPREWRLHPGPYSSRVAFAAAHVVADPRGDNVPGAPAAIDWDATLAFRRHLFGYGLGVAEGMDTAQRNMGLDWRATQELISRSAAQASELGGRIASGAGTDQLPDAATAAAPATLADVERAYLEQIAFVEGTGSQAIIMASRHLARAAAGPDDYLTVYDRILGQTSAPVILHWLGEVFDPQLRSYWGSTDVGEATESFLTLVRAHADKIDGVKVSLLSAEHEIGLRHALPDGVRLYTGDDFNYPELIRGDDHGHSDALLGAFAAIAPAASAALQALDDGDLARYDAELAPTLELSRHIFEAPTFHYKVGIAFSAWLTGHQAGFQMVGGLQSARSLPHLGRIFELMNDARLLPDPELAHHRLLVLAEALGAAR
ncbi:dihydrodipicolinate synthase family protein [Naasia lichenicola]|uniref:Dihydrodipicolinate synthase family protein n=1 Tax=Naasia lichenicola TaxID=2565933 RepID=A0A4S4FH42_9MICO|nr:dihydrodipicolinate synthase family protein [Naasia lichenicola]THG29609.1 dihydrodipicolinate synthase family protein [Naasia lichenicola]